MDSARNGAHQDLNLALMERSARSLQPTFHALAEQSWRRPADIALRETVGRLGREGEAQMMLATGVNTHRGAIWALGLLVSAVAMLGGEGQSQAIADAAAALARLPDGFAPKSFSKGLRASRRWQVPSAREEAQCGFPHITRGAAATTQQSRARGASEPQAQRCADGHHDLAERYLRAVARRYGRAAGHAARRLRGAGGWRLRQFRRARRGPRTQSCWR